MGSKRGRLLMRQHRIKKETEVGTGEEEERSGAESSAERSTPRIERHSSEPSPHHLSVPHYLPKQNSSPHLNVPAHHSQVIPSFVTRRIGRYN